MTYTVITENDVSQWSDKTGAEYHFPKRYAKFLTPGTTVVYYKGKLKDKAFRDQRLSDEPHYFGVATIEQEPYQDEESEKGDLYVAIENFTPFAQAVPNKLPGTDDYIETIPESRQRGSTPFPRTVLKRLITSDPERQLYVASWDYGTVRCNRIRQLALRSASGNAGDELAPV